ncbi:MAG: hypothetical protein LBS65_02460 [Desulfovibrio sp.]|nr:hypothetical protein [Desulfovibrio sp.]
MKTRNLLLFVYLPLLLLAGCSEEAKIDSVKKTAVNNCKGKTMQDLASGLLQNPVWGFKKAADGREFVTLGGTVAGDKVPAWIKDKKVLDISFSFALDAKSGKFDPGSLDGFPSLTSPEGIFQGYKAIVCN